jgi:hypothetical protein
VIFVKDGHQRLAILAAFALVDGVTALSGEGLPQCKLRFASYSARAAASKPAIQDAVLKA